VLDTWARKCTAAFIKGVFGVFMKLRNVALISLITMSTQAFAVCERERDEYADWNGKCETLSAASQVTGTGGGLFAIVTLGLSLIPCAAAIVAAKNACRIKDEKKQNLERCEAHVARLTHEAQEAADRSIAEEQARQTRIAQLNSDFGNQRTLIIQQYHQMIENFRKAFVEEGWNLDDLESQELLRTTCATMEHERDQKLDQLEIERRQAISHA